MEAIDGDTLRLDDGRELRLAGIEAPKTGPLAEQAKSALTKLIQGHSLSVRFGGAKSDRYGRMVGHGQRDDGRWLEGSLVEAGRVRVHTTPDNHALAAELLALEGEARSARRGLWTLRGYVVRDALDDLNRDLDSFQIVEGRVTTVSRRNIGAYLNFGADWRTDFTLFISKSVLHRLEKAGIDPAAWQDKRLRARGWLIKRNGPMIEINHPEQIEVLEPRQGASPPDTP
ncbi:micrococcal nuclease [uncultured Gammaproteobacteria bacterium]